MIVLILLTGLRHVCFRLCLNSIINNSLAIVTIVAVFASVVSAVMPLPQVLIQRVSWLISQVASFIQRVITPTVQCLQPVTQRVVKTLADVIQGIARVVKDVEDIDAGIFSGDWKRVVVHREIFWDGEGGYPV